MTNVYHHSDEYSSETKRVADLKANFLSRLVLFFGVSCFFHSGFAKTEPLKGNSQSRSEMLEVSAQIKKILAPKGAKVSFSLRALDGHELISLNGDKPLAPASIAKTVSTACSLDILGPNFQFETVFGFKGKVKDDVLDGDLVISGSGDPSLVIEDLREVVEKLRFVHGIRRITGSLIFDVSYFGQKGLPIAEGFSGDEGRSFAAELTPISMNQSSFSFWIASDIRDPSRSRVVTLPANVVKVEVSNKVKAGSVTELNVNYNFQKQEATTLGTISADSEPKGIYRAVEDAYAYNLRLMHRLWLDSGGEWKEPTLQISTSQVKSNLLWRHSSRSLSRLMMDVNKLSLNLGAEMILLAASADEYGRPASFEKSMKLINKCLADRGIADGGIFLNNGSGLSREARIKVSALSQFLSKISESPYWPEYLSSFAILGVDGTAKSRLKKYVGRARIKTGSLKDVRSIAGYLYSKDYEVYSFAMIQNGISNADAKSLEDQVLQVFLKKD